MAGDAMGVPENINWLKENKLRYRTFVAIAMGRASKIRELREQLNMSDWWPVKQHVKDLVDRGLIIEADGNCGLTEDGQKLLESIRAVLDLEKL
jgi:predicted transcriptional regulator